MTPVEQKSPYNQFLDRMLERIHVDELIARDKAGKRAKGLFTAGLIATAGTIFADKGIDPILTISAVSAGIMGGVYHMASKRPTSLIRSVVKGQYYGRSQEDHVNQMELEELSAERALTSGQDSITSGKRVKSHKEPELQDYRPSNLLPNLAKVAGGVILIGGCAILGSAAIEVVKEGVEATQNFIETTNWGGVGVTVGLLTAVGFWGKAVIKGAFSDDAPSQPESDPEPKRIPKAWQ